MSNLQVPDPGLLCKLENFLLDNIEDHCLDVRIVCSDGEFSWSSVLLSAISPVMKSLLLPQSSSGGVTKISCADVGPYIGNSSLGNITVVDTPGFGVNIEEEEEAIEQLAA